MDSLQEYADELENEMIGKTNNPDLVAQTGMDEDTFYDEMMKGLKSGGMSWEEYLRWEEKEDLKTQREINEHNSIRRVHAG